MSTPLSSVAPRSSSLTVPSTQNTAPVVKFRCLFTHDIRRKAKRWQDGFLRYHTFNKRVMVYDNTGYFIGDLHWRAPEGINDGDELELDKGVLIQVCEPLERTETDLSSLYKNKNQASPSRRGDAPPSSVHSAAPRSSVSSQQASRSLNDLLGIKKTPVPQLPSPYEQRHRQKPISMHRLHERPAKRQRISPEPITSGQQDVVNLSDSPPPRRQNTNTQSRPNPHSISQNRRTAVLPEPQLSTGSHSTSETQAPPSSGRPTAQSVSQNLKASSSGAGSSVSTLRLSGSKPRRKLMYQEASLAPVKKTGSQDPLPRADSQRQTINQAASSHVIVLDGDSPKLDNDPTADDDSILDDDDLFSAIQTTVPHQENPALDDDSPKLDDDPIPDDDSILDDDNVFSDLQTTVPHQENPAQVDSDSSLSRIHSPNNNVEGSVDPKTCAPNPAATELPPELNNSNNTIPLPRSDPPLPTGQHNTKILENIARPRSTGLRKSYSDPTTINSLHTRPLPTTSPLNPSVDKDDEQGPWTSEALDLFDFWPPGRPKPT